MPDDSLKLDKMVEFMISGLESMLADPIVEETCFFPTLAQMCVEIARYYFVVEDYERAIAYFEKTQGLMEMHRIEKSFYLYCRFTSEMSVEEIQKFVRILKGIRIPQVSDPITIENLVTQIIAFKRYSDPQVMELLLMDSIHQTISIEQKVLIRTEVSNAKQLYLCQLVSFCIALSRSMTGQAGFELVKQIDRDLVWISWNTSILHTCMEMMMKLAVSDSFPTHIPITNWKERWSSILFAKTSHIQGALDVLVAHPFMRSFFETFPTLKKIGLDQKPVYNRLENLVSKSNDEVGAILMELFLTGLSEQESTQVGVLMNLTMEVGPDVYPLALEQVRSLIEKDQFDAAELLLQFIKARILKLLMHQPSPPDIQNLEATILVSRVVHHLGLLDTQTQALDIKNISTQLLESTSAATPLDLKSFMKLLTTLISKGEGETSFAYIQQIKALQKPDHSTSLAMFNLGRIIILVATTVEFLKTFGVMLENSAVDMEKLHTLPDEFIAELVSFSTQIVTWISGEDIVDMIYDVHTHLMEYLKKSPPGVWDLIIGLVGGALNRLVPETKRMDIESLGIYAVFSLPGTYPWHAVGCQGLETRVTIQNECSLSESSREHGLSFLKKCCETKASVLSLRSPNTYRLWSDIHYIHGDLRKSVVEYLNAILVASNQFSDTTKLNQFVQGSFLERMIKLLTELHGTRD
jgi:hypothetical protein